MNNLLQGITKENIITICVILGVIASILIIIKLIVNKKRQPRYFVKDKLLTATEVKYYDAICSVVGNNFLVFPEYILDILDNSFVLLYLLKYDDKMDMMIFLY